MDYHKVIRDLYADKQKLDRVIAELERLQSDESGAAAQPRSSRGRKFMAAEERQEVSRRMKKYWAARRKQQLQ